MKNPNVLAVLAALIFLTGVGCALDKNISGVSSVDPVELQMPSDDSLFVSIFRTPCFGTCPFYDMRIYEGGLVLLNRKMHWDSLGRIDSTQIGWFITVLPQIRLTEIRSRAQEIGFFDFKDAYLRGPVTDLPTTTTFVNVNGLSKQVINENYKVPEAVINFENFIDSKVANSEWIRVVIVNSGKE
ncbi:MAG: hypothetical protein IIA45_08460 [Bacteroidetes bacterium]|nr:hypothetical protein [Bacteroidota bacterium]